MFLPKPYRCTNKECSNHADVLRGFMIFDCPKCGSPLESVDMLKEKVDVFISEIEDFLKRQSG